MKKKKKLCKKVIKGFCESHALPAREYPGGFIIISCLETRNMLYDKPARITIEWTEP